MVPREAFFTRGVGRHKERLQSFEWALRQAGIAQFNLVRVSSIWPPNCKIIPKLRGIGKLRPGEIVHAVLTDTSTNERGRNVFAGIGLAVPAKGDSYGYISEHHCYGMAAREGADYGEDMAASMLASTLGIDFDPETGYDERKEIYRMSGKIVRTRAMVQTATGGPNGMWTTVVAAAVFVP